jgi:hypothetical protein
MLGISRGYPSVKSGHGSRTDSGSRNDGLSDTSDSLGKTVDCALKGHETSVRGTGHSVNLLSKDFLTETLGLLKAVNLFFLSSHSDLVSGNLASHRFNPAFDDVLIVSTRLSVDFLSDFIGIVLGLQHGVLSLKLGQLTTDASKKTAKTSVVVQESQSSTSDAKTKTSTSDTLRGVFLFIVVRVVFKAAHV